MSNFYPQKVVNTAGLSALFGSGGGADDDDDDPLVFSSTKPVAPVASSKGTATIFGSSKVRTFI
jgi:hypothetical protein